MDWRLVGVRPFPQVTLEGAGAAARLRDSNRNRNNGDVMAQVKLSRRWRSEEGAELVEFALVLPMLLFVVLGIAEFGFIFQRYEVLTNAAREGARLAVLPGYTRPTSDSRGRLCDHGAAFPG